MYSVKSHILHRDGAPVSQRKTPNMGGVIRPEILVMHYTSGPTAEGAISWLCNPAAKASAHLVIDLDGTVTQLVPFNRAAWHAGVSSYHGRPNCNGFSIGIELANVGELKTSARGEYIDPIRRKVVDADHVIVAAHKNGGGVHGWMAYDPRQIEAAEDVARALVETYKLRDVVGHDDVAPNRKVDPGPAFPMRQFYARVLGRQAA